MKTGRADGDRRVRRGAPPPTRLGNLTRSRAGSGARPILGSERSANPLIGSPAEPLRRTRKGHEDTARTHLPCRSRSLPVTLGHWRSGGRAGQRPFCPSVPDHSEWSWRESNPRPASGHRPCYDHSRDLGSTAADLPGQVDPRIPPPGLSLESVVFHTVSGLSLPSPPLLLPGCDGLAPCAIAGHDFSRSPEWIRRRERTAHRRFFGLPCLTSLSNSGRTQRLSVPPSKPISPW